MDETQDAVWPRGAKAAGAKPLAKRLDTLEGKTVAFLWDYMFRGDEIFPLIERELGAAYPGVKFIGYDNFGTTHGGGEREVNAALTTNRRRPQWTGGSGFFPRISVRCGWSGTSALPQLTGCRR